MGISGLAVELEAIRPLGLRLAMLGFRLVLSANQIILLSLLEIILGGYFLILLHQEEQQEAIVVGQA